MRKPGRTFLADRLLVDMGPILAILQKFCRYFPSNQKNYGSAQFPRTTEPSLRRFRLNLKFNLHLRA